MAEEHICGPSSAATSPSQKGRSYHRRNNLPWCGLLKATSAWATAERNAGRELPDFMETYKPVDEHICGTAEEAEEASGAGVLYHYRKGTKACGKANAERNLYKKERKEAVKNMNLAPPVDTYICGEASEAERPSKTHYNWHIYWSTEPCGKALREMAWAAAEDRAGCSLPNWTPGRKPTFHECGTAEDAEGPFQGHYIWHKKQGTELCEKARVENNWCKYENRAGHPVADYKPINRMNGYECGEAEDAEGPSEGHYSWHLSNKTTPCGLALAERSWRAAEKHAGRSLPDYKRTEPLHYECGEAEDVERPSWSHYNWHRRKNTLPCGLAKAEMVWSQAENRAGHPLPDYPQTKTMRELDWDAPTVLYRYSFEDGDAYWGITSSPDPEVRWKRQRAETTPLGEKIRSKVPFFVEVVAKYMDRRTAAEMERLVIQGGNPFGTLLNVVHNG